MSRMRGGWEATTDGWIAIDTDGRTWQLFVLPALGAKRKAGVVVATLDGRDVRVLGHMRRTTWRDAAKAMRVCEEVCTTGDYCTDRKRVTHACVE